MCLQVFRSSPVHAPVRQPPVEELLKGKADQIIRDYRGADPARRGAILMALGRQRQKGDRSNAGILARIVSDKSLRKLAEKPCRTIVSETLKQTLHRRHGGWVYEEPQVSKLMQLPTFILQLGAPNGSDERKLTRRVLVKYLEWINHDHDLYEKRATETEKEFGQFRLNYLTWRDEYRRLGKDGLDLSAFLGERHGKLFTSSHMFEQRSDPRGFLDRVKDPKTPDGLLDLLVRMYDARTDQRFDQCREKVGTVYEDLMAASDGRCVTLANLRDRIVKISESLDSDFEKALKRLRPTTGTSRQNGVDHRQSEQTGVTVTTERTGLLSDEYRLSC